MFIISAASGYIDVHSRGRNLQPTSVSKALNILNFLPCFSLYLSLLCCDQQIDISLALEMEQQQQVLLSCHSKGQNTVVRLHYCWSAVCSDALGINMFLWLKSKFAPDIHIDLYSVQKCLCLFLLLGLLMIGCTSLRLYQFQVPPSPLDGK